MWDVTIQRGYVSCSKPPSSDGFKLRTKCICKKSGKKPSAQKGHQGHHLQRVETPDEVIIHAVSTCGHCACDLTDQQVSYPEDLRCAALQEAGAGLPL